MEIESPSPFSNDHVFFYEKLVFLLNKLKKTHFYTEKNRIFLIILQLIDKYSSMIFKNDKYIPFVLVVEKKLIEFEKEFKEHEKETNKKNRRISVICQKYLAKYFGYDYDFQCQACALNGSRCKNIRKNNSDYFCNTHHNKYLPKINKMLSDILVPDISLVCVQYIFI